MPEPEELTAADQEILAMIEKGFDTVGKEYETVHLRAALGEAMRLATEVNRYLDQTAPWTSIKTDKQAAARAIFTAIRAIDNLKILLAPVLPHTAERLHRILGYPQPLFGQGYLQEVEDALGSHTVVRYDPDSASGQWQPSQIQPGTPLQKPEPLFKKLDASIIEEERARLGKPAAI